MGCVPRIRKDGISGWYSEGRGFGSLWGKQYMQHDIHAVGCFVVTAVRQKLEEEKKGQGEGILDSGLHDAISSGWVRVFGSWFDRVWVNLVDAEGWSIYLYMVSWKKRSEINKQGDTDTCSLVFME